MDRIRPRGVVTLLLAAALLVWLAAPLSAAPPARVGASAAGATEVRTVPGFADALMAWLSDLWPGVWPGDGPRADVKALGVDIDPSGQPGSQSVDSCVAPSGALTVTPQNGCVIDPDG